MIRHKKNLLPRFCSEMKSPLPEECWGPFPLDKNGMMQGFRVHLNLLEATQFSPFKIFLKGSDNLSMKDKRPKNRRRYLWLFPGSKLNPLIRSLISQTGEFVPIKGYFIAFVRLCQYGFWTFTRSEYIWPSAQHVPEMASIRKMNICGSYLNSDFFFAANCEWRTWPLKVKSHPWIKHLMMVRIFSDSEFAVSRCPSRF